MTYILNSIARITFVSERTSSRRQLLSLIHISMCIRDRVSGHRIGPAEVENAINMHAGVVESAVVGYTHDIKGQGIYAYVIFENTHDDENLTKLDIIQTVSRVIGAIAKPDKIQFVNGLPKTRSGKIMRRILRKIAEGEIENLGDTSTLLDPSVVDEIKDGKI